MSDGELSAGAYEALVTEHVHKQLSMMDGRTVARENLADGDADELLARHVAALTRRALRAIRGDTAAGMADKVALANTIARAVVTASKAADVDELVHATENLLTAIADVPDTPAPPRFPDRPTNGLHREALLVNGREQPRIAGELVREFSSADRVDLLCAFVKHTGLRIFDGAIRDFIARGGRLRVITTTYMGATEARAVDRLAELGAEVRISYDTRNTRLHAKAWLFHRRTGYGTAYVGSSNLSKSAMLDGLEWNVRLSQARQPQVLDQFRVTFEEYWNDSGFVPYQRDQRAELDRRLRGEGATGPSAFLANLLVHPFGYQQEVLDELAAERVVHDRWRSLVAMATGTGKTVVAGLDYQRLVREGHVNSLLFVAHQKEILRQSRDTFRQILRDRHFGELFVDGHRPEQWTHVFASIQSLTRLDEDALRPDRFDIVIVDEFHHAAASTYAKLLDHLRPKVLLGLSATPERADGQDVTHWFDNASPIELRLWEALERGFLVPFQYFGLHDGTDLSTIAWKRGSGYESAALTAAYTKDRRRTDLILRAVADIVTDPNAMRAIGFCVSIAHAEHMANAFTGAGIPAEAVTSRQSSDVRVAARTRLEHGDTKVLFTVDLYNEGVDLPDVDTVLFLRPTESATVFLQQLGRGLRLSEGKSCLTVLDFIGTQRDEFRFDRRLMSLTGLARRDLESAVAKGFPELPPGCHLEFDSQSRDIVLRNIRKAISNRPAALAEELRLLGAEASLADFLAHARIDMEDMYRKKGGTWAELRRTAGIATWDPGPDEDRLRTALPRMLHIDDPTRLDFLRRVLHSETLDQPGDDRLVEMLRYTLWPSRGGPDSATEALARLRANPVRLNEIRELLAPLNARMHRVTVPIGGRIPLHLHARYSRNELLAAFGVDKPYTVREGVHWVKADKADVFMVTLKKKEKDYSPSTMYADVALSPELFQWESQSTTKQSDPKAVRYVNHEAEGSTIHLFMREHAEKDGELGVPPYFYAGTVRYVAHEGERPIRFVWKLDTDLPADVYHAAKIAVG